MNRIGYNSNSNYNVSFRSNKGVLKAIETLKKNTNSENIQELQAQAQDVKLTPDFIAEIEKVTPEDLKVLAKKILGLMPWK